MAIKFMDDGCTFPTIIENGVLSYIIGPYKYDVPIPWCKYNFKNDFSYWRSNQIKLFARNEDDIILIVRKDKTATFYKDDIVIGKTHMELPDITTEWEVSRRFATMSDEDEEDENSEIYEVTTYRHWQGETLIFDPVERTGAVILTRSTAPRIFEQYDVATYFGPVYYLSMRGDNVEFTERGQKEVSFTGVRLKPTKHEKLV